MELIDPNVVPWQVPLILTGGSATALIIWLPLMALGTVSLQFGAFVIVVLMWIGTYGMGLGNRMMEQDHS